MRHVSRWGRVAAALATVMLVAACAGGADVPVGTPVASTNGDGGVRVELAEWSVKAPASAKAGKLEFTARNNGSTPHELVVLRTDTNATALQKNASGLVDEAKYGAVGKTKQLVQGQTEPLEATLAAGKYVLICNVPGHYGLGMRAAFTVE